MKRFLGVFLVLGALIFVSPGCYTLRSAAIPTEMRTINIGFFENDAGLVVANLSQNFTEALKARIRTTTRLSIVNGEGDANMSGSITDYHYAPVSIQASNPNLPPIANAEVLSITVHVKFVYTAAKTEADKRISFDQSFTKTANFTGDITNQEQTLIQTITSQLIDDIFNKAFNNW
jgi:ethanolamine utilization microcompartment shell protein EutS